ncbi:hypothetical protein MVEN_02536500 [Mycena venus]|uniref:Uncharacterized protein n=1 Tax=Mycena venus TaxID=2733690 RepID=A0A8H6U513_9AGAR|nr:hypothetical protein MVEN_02536500 [Mycena venus]
MTHDKGFCPLPSPMPTPRLLLLPLLFTLLTLSTARAALTNITIDDTDLSYFTWTEDAGESPAPTIPWAAISPGTPCLYCSAQPQTSDIENKTWHDGTNNSAGSFTFQGSAVYLYGIDLDNPANISFTMDGAAAGFHYYSGSEQFVFRSLFFSATNLALGSVNHTVSWVLHATKTNGTTGLFDYAVITVDGTRTNASNSAGLPSSTSSSVPSTKSKSKSNAGPIAGGVVGGLALIAAIVLIVVFLRRRRRRSVAPGATAEGRKPRRPTDVQPFMEQVASPASAAPGSVGEKMLDVAWMSPAANTTAPIATESTINLSSVPASVPTTHPSPPSALSASASAPTHTDADALTTAPTTTTSARERELEERLAQLEAQVQQHLPPPYIPPPSPRE